MPQARVDGGGGFGGIETGAKERSEAGGDRGGAFEDWRPRSRHHITTAGP